MMTRFDNTVWDRAASFSRETVPRSQKSRRILIVDDQWAAIQRVGPILGEMGHEIIPALDGATALKRAACALPDLVLMDLLLPDMDGCEVCRRLHETPQGKDIPVIFVSAADEKDLVIRALRAGGADYITKPFDQAELISRVRTQLALKSTRDDLEMLAENKDQMLGMLTHDLKGSLAGVVMSAELLLDRLANLNDETALRRAMDILERSRRLLDFVKDFLAHAAAAHTQDEAPHSSVLSERDARIMVVDDQPANIQMVGSLLGKLGYEIISATDGPTALKRMALRPPDLILLDLFMPGMDGLEICRQASLLANGQDVPVIFLSAADDKNSVVRALETGGVDFITKPFHRAELILRVQMHLALKFNRDRLAKLARERNELMALLAEDFKEQFGRMHDDAQELRRQVTDRADSQSFQLADNIFHSCTELSGFVEWFIAKGRQDLILNPVRLDLAAAATRSLQRFREPARRKNLSLLMVSDDEAAFVQADEFALNQILDNLISNAVKFSPPGKSVRLTIQKASGAVECHIQDQGPGLTAEDKARMFRRYGRLSACPTAGEASTGLGLSIVRQLARAMDGDVTCQSSPGQGAMFTVYLPPATDSP
jgi:two-component system sensor histidine kinase/response regulator